MCSLVVYMNVHSQFLHSLSILFPFVKENTLLISLSPLHTHTATMMYYERVLCCSLTHNYLFNNETCFHLL